MKILIWVHKNDVLADKILTYHLTRPMMDRHDQYLQVEITQDEFARLEDKKYTNIEPSSVYGCDHPQNKDWLLDQYNRNKDQKDWATSIDQMKK